jgi:hypothetical protein
MMVQIASRNCTATLAHRFNSHWLLQILARVWSKLCIFLSFLLGQQLETEKLHISEVTGMKQTYECDIMPIFPSKLRKVGSKFTLSVRIC